MPIKQCSVLQPRSSSLDNAISKHPAVVCSVLSVCTLCYAFIVISSSKFLQPTQPGQQVAWSAFQETCLFLHQTGQKASRVSSWVLPVHISSYRDKIVFRSVPATERRGYSFDRNRNWYGGISCWKPTYHIWLNYILESYQNGFLLYGIITVEIWKIITTQIIIKESYGVLQYRFCWDIAKEIGKKEVQ